MIGRAGQARVGGPGGMEEEEREGGDRSADRIQAELWDKLVIFQWAGAGREMWV